MNDSHGALALAHRVSDADSAIDGNGDGELGFTTQSGWGQHNGDLETRLLPGSPKML